MSENHLINLAKSSIAEPRACARKYVIAASVSEFDFIVMIIGINLSRFNSSEIQIKSQLDLDTVMIVLIISIGITIADIGDINIGIWRS